MRLAALHKIYAAPSIRAQRRGDTNKKSAVSPHFFVEQSSRGYADGVRAVVVRPVRAIISVTPAPLPHRDLGRRDWHSKQPDNEIQGEPGKIQSDRLPYVLLVYLDFVGEFMPGNVRLAAVVAFALLGFGKRC